VPKIKIRYFLWHPVVGNLEIFSVQIGDEFVFCVRDCRGTFTSSTRLRILPSCDCGTIVAGSYMAER